VYSRLHCVKISVIQPARHAWGKEQ
jgi:hypothetical protein